MANYVGTSGGDYIVGTTAADFILGEAGNDTINGNGGQDSLYGGQGNDSISFSGSGDDLVFGGFGADTINVSGSGLDSVYGSDDINGAVSDGANVINASSSNALGAASTNRDLLVGAGGNDTIIASDYTFTTVSSAIGRGGSTTVVPTADPIAVDTMVGARGNDLYVFGTTVTSFNGAFTTSTSAGFNGSGGSAKGYSNGNATNARSVDSVKDFISGMDKFHFSTGSNFTAGNNDQAQFQVNVSNATTLAQAADAALTGSTYSSTGARSSTAAGSVAVAQNQAVIFAFQGSEFLTIQTQASGTQFGSRDYLINVGNLSSVTSADLNG